MTTLFLNPWFLIFGAVSLAAPIIIHLLRNRTFVPAYLGTTRFLAAILRDNQRRRKLQDLLLLLARLLLLILLAAIFARPVLQDPRKQDAKRLHAIVLVDCSASMSAAIYGTPNSEIAKARLKKTLESFPSEASVTVAAFSDAVRKLANPNEPLPAPAGAGDPGQALLWALEQFKNSTSENRQVFLISDLQIPAETRPLPQWPENVRLHLLDTALPAAWNAALSAPAMLAFDQAPKASLPVTIQTFGTPPAAKPEDKPPMLVLRIEGEKPVAMPLTLPLAGNPASLSLTFPMPKPGTYRTTVTLENVDGYAFDNTRHLLLHIRHPRNLLIVDGARGRTRFQDETYFLRHALDAAMPAGNALFQYQFRYDHTGDTAAFQTVVLANVPALSSEDTRQLQALLARGGNVLFFLGDQIQPAAYNQLALPGLFPATLAPNAKPETQVIVTWSADHPVLGRFDPRDPATLSQLPFIPRFKVTPVAAATMLATLDNGQPAILQMASGTGSVLLINNSANRDWSNWAIDPLYAPLMTELLGYLAKPAGEQIPKLTEATTSITTPELILGLKLQPGKPGFAIHHPAAESATAPILDADAFRTRLNLPKPDQAEPPTLSPPIAPAGASRPDEFWHWLALSLLLFVVIEAALAHRKRRP